MDWNKNTSLTTIVFRWFSVALILLATCSLTLESATKCETCRELVKHFKEVLMVLQNF